MVGLNKPLNIPAKWDNVYPDDISKIEFNNGNTIEFTSTESENHRGERSKLIMIYSKTLRDLLCEDLKWHQKLRIYIYFWWTGLIGKFKVYGRGSGK